jgi:geranyl-CoA carboxylase alpha subunit
MPINKILIANRGEIAVRIIGTAQALGYETVAVFSEADAGMPHVTMADQAVLLGPAEVGQSYLNVERLLAAARQAGADALHPGYGFLSENAAFARQVIQAELTWIGPPAEAMEIMGDKAAARQAMLAAEVPCVPGYAGEAQSDEAFMAAAESIGYPVMVKATAGGGGRGIRLVKRPDDLAGALVTARSEALQAFGSDELLLEKAIENPRHVEIQVFGDRQGNLLYLGERDCSIQRRHQKVVEESPSPAVSSELRERMGQTAVAAAKAVGYYSAGTVEFLLDETGQFYFIEMNTRLQVEHPVTEKVTGLDLVAWQLLVAEGRPLPLRQAEVSLQGHAIEARLYAEESHNQFLPGTGQVYLWRPPTGEGLRVDHGLVPGMAITPYYDAMIAKIIAWGETREIARRRLRRALLNTVLFGVTTNRRFLLETAAHPIFVKGEATTNFIEEVWRPTGEENVSPRLQALAALLFYQRNRAEWMLDWRSRPFSCCFEGSVVRVTAVAPSQYDIQTEQESFHIRSLSQNGSTLRFEQDGLHDMLHFAFEPDGKLWLQHELETVSFVDMLLAPAENEDTTSDGIVTAPMPGAIRRIQVTIGERVAKGQPLLILEAMKMEQAIPAPVAGTVVEILVQIGQQMKANDLLMVIKAEER